MATSLQELLQLAGLTDQPKTRPRRAEVIERPPESSDPYNLEFSGQNPLNKQPAPPIPVAAQEPPRSLPPINAEPPPSQDVRPRFTDPASEAQNERIQSFGSSGEPFGSTRQRRTQPRDYVADELAYQRELENKPRNKVLDVLSGITTGVSALGGQPATPVDFSGRDRSMRESFDRLNRELGVQVEQAKIKSIGSQQDYRRSQTVGAQQKRMIDLYKALPKYTRGERPEIDAMFASAGLEFENKDPKTAKPGATKMFRMNGQQYILPSGTTEAQVVTGQGGSELLDPTQVPVEAQGAVSGETYTVRPGTALGAEATQSGQRAAQGRFETSEARQSQQFQTQQYQQQKERADKAAQELIELQASADTDEAAARALNDKWQGQPFGQDAVDMVGYQSRAAARRKQAQALSETVRRSYGDFYDVGPDGAPRPKATQAPAPSQPASAPSTQAPRYQVDHAKFEKMYAEAKTPEERSKLMKQYQEALKAAGQ